MHLQREAGRGIYQGVQHPGVYREAYSPVYRVLGGRKGSFSLFYWSWEAEGASFSFFYWSWEAREALGSLFLRSWEAREALGSP